MEVTVITFEIECRKGNFKIQFQRQKAYEYIVIVMDIKLEKVIYRALHTWIHTVAASSAMTILESILKD